MDHTLILILGIIGVIVAPAVTTRPALMLTPYVNENRIIEARNLSVVNPKLFLNVTSYSGFFTVDEKYNSNVFFWYFPVANRNVSETPWIIWLQGGPGASSLVGLFDEMGPFEYQDDGRLRLRATSWCKDYSMLFIDNPVGAGFSFTDHLDGIPRDMDTYAEHLLSTVQQFVAVFPELRRAPLYLAGSSYAGRYVPGLATRIDQLAHQFNLQGLILGNPVLNRDNIMDYSTTFYQWGLIDEQGVLAAKPLQDNYTRAVLDGNNQLAADLRNSLLDKLQDISFQNEIYNLLKDDDDFLREFKKLLQWRDIREAIHVGDLGFTFSNASVHKSLVPDFLNKISPKVEVLLDNHKMLIYCGQLDLTAACVPNAAARRRWRWSGSERFLAAPRLPWWHDGTVAGYVKSGGGLTEVLVRGAGHLAPIDKPAEVQLLVNFFIRGLDLPTPPNYHQEKDDTPPYQSLHPRQLDGSVPKYVDNSGDSNAGLVFSIILNVILVISIVALVFWFTTWKRKNDALFIPLREDIFNVA